MQGQWIRFLVVLLVTTAIGVISCKKDEKLIYSVETVTVTNTVTNTVTIHHYYYEAPLLNPADVLGYSCYNIDNSMAGEHYSTISVGSFDTGGAPWGNGMDVGFISFDIGSLTPPANATLTSIQLNLFLTSALSNSLDIHITLQNQSTGNATEMADFVYSGLELSQGAVQDNAAYAFTLDAANISLISGVLYLGLWADTTWENQLDAIFEPSQAYLLVEYVLQE